MIRRMLRQFPHLCIILPIPECGPPVWPCAPILPPSRPDLLQPNTTPEPDFKRTPSLLAQPTPTPTQPQILFQEDYETFKEHMEEKADRQDAISSSLEDAQTRLEDAEASLSALAEELEHSSQDTRVWHRTNADHLTGPRRGLSRACRAPERRCWGAVVRAW